MPRYYFHVDDRNFVPDIEGLELPDLKAARAEAVKAAGEILSDLDGDLWAGEKLWCMHVADEMEQLLFTLRFSAEVPSGPVIFRPTSGQSGKRQL